MLDVQYVWLMWTAAILSVILACWLLVIVYCDGKVWAARFAALLFAFALTLVGTVFSDSLQMAGTIALVAGLGLCLALLEGLVRLARKRHEIIEAAKPAKPAEAAAEQ